MRRSLTISPHVRRDLRRAVLADITRREWLLQMLAITAASCRRDRAQPWESTLTVFYSLGSAGGAQENVFLDGSAQWLVFEPLMKRNAQGELEGRLARSWEHSADYRTWTIHLRTDVRWQDGVPVTAHDIKFTIDLLSRPDVLELPPGAFSVTVLDDSTYTISYLEGVAAAQEPHGTGGRMIPGGEPPQDAVVYYPNHLLEHLEPKAFRSWDFWTHPVGNGPYRFVRQVPMTMTEYEANPTYYLGRPKIRRVVLQGLTAESALNELRSGQIQATWLDGKGVLLLRGDRRFRMYYSIKTIFMHAIAWNQGHPLFRQASVRRALTLAINRRELQRVLNLPDQIPIVDVPFSDRQFWHGELPDPLPYDPAEARRLLEEAGWHDVGGGRARERQGSAFHFTVLAGPGAAATAVYIQAQLRLVGIQMDIQTMDDALVNARRNTGAFEALITSRLPTRLGDLVKWFGEGSPLQYTNPRVIALLGRARHTLDPDEIDQIYRELMPIVQADMPVTFLYPSISWTVASRHLHGLSSPYHADMVMYMEDLWLDQ